MFQVQQSRPSRLAHLIAIAAAAALIVPGGAHAQQPPPPPPSRMPLPKADPPPQRIITQGLGKTIVEDLVACANARPGMNLRKNPVGEITAKDG